MTKSMRVSENEIRRQGQAACMPPFPNAPRLEVGKGSMGAGLEDCEWSMGAGLKDSEGSLGVGLQKSLVAEVGGSTTEEGAGEEAHEKLHAVLFVHSLIYRQCQAQGHREHDNGVNK